MKRLLFTLMAIAFYSLMSVNAQADEVEEYTGYAEEISEYYDVSPYIIIAMIETESKFKPEATSSSNCKGLMQINPRFHKARMEALEVDDLYEPYGNILVGTHYLRELLNTYGNMHEALMVYNMGNKGAELYKQGKISYYAKTIVKRAEELEQKG